MSSLSNTMPLGGLEALVAAASAAKQASGSEKRTKKQRKGKDDQPAVQEASPSDTAKALASLFSNQIFVQALAASSQHAASGGSMPIDPRLQFQAPPLDHHNIQSANGGAGPSQYGQSHTAGHGSTPFQQTRSGRISRPPLVPPSYNLLQALASEADSPNFDALLHAVSGTGHPGDANSAGHGGIQAQGSTEHHTSQSRAGFWHQNDATNGFEGANTLAEVEQTANATRGNKRALSSVEGDEEGESSLTGASNLPAWPLPPMGPGGRKNMPKEELLARRRARNRVSALQARQKKREFFGSLETQLKEKEAAYTALEAHCHNLESQLEQLRQIVQSAGLPLPSGFSTPNLPGMPAENAAPQMDFITDLAGTNTSSWNGFQDDNLPSFDMFFNMDMDGEEDGEFLPPSSPQNESDDERPTPSTVQGKETPRPTGKNKGKGKGKSKRVRINADGSDDEDDDDDDDEGDDFVDEDEEDEDLFLPIEDVPVPPDAQVEVAMRSLGVDNQEELARLINKMVVAGKEGMTSEMVDKLKVLLSLVGPNGGWTGGVGGPLAADDSVESQVANHLQVDYST